MTGGEETESKHRVPEEARLLAALDALGFGLREVGHHLDEYYDSPTGVLRTGDVVCRLRLYPDRVVATFKGPRRPHPDGSHSRIEVEVPAAGADAVRAALAEQGLVRTWRLEKRRRIYRHPDRPVDVCLDELPALGLFVELEGPPTQIGPLRRELGATIGPAEPLNYHELTLAWRANAGLPAGDGLIFPGP